MKRDDGVRWRHLGWIEKAFLALMAIWALLFFTGMAQRYQTLSALAAILMGVLALVKIGRMAMRNLIWRLRNRLIVAYLFIAVVPIVLILALMLVTSYALVGQMAVYMAQKELDNRMARLAFPAEMLTRAPSSDPQASLSRTLPMMRRVFPQFEMLATGEQHFRYPPDSTLAAPPEAWKNSSGLITKKVGDTESLFAWAHAERGGNEVTILSPITTEVLSGLVEGIGDIEVVGKTRRPEKSHVPPAVNEMDLGVSFAYPVFVASWENPQGPPQKLYLLVHTRYSAVLGIVFGQKADWSDVMMTSLLLLGGTQLCMAVEQWRIEHRAALRGWLDAWAEFEALNALANYAYENPENTFPDFSTEGARFEAEGLGHPLLPRASCVGNDVQLNRESRFYVVSGSNMSGKSTLLRAIGLNAVLALAGAPVRARALRLSRLSVCASVSVVDSPLNGKSKFMAEVDRLRHTIQVALEGESVLFLIDEIFGGTNSRDRRVAAEAVVRTLVNQGAIGALSTHDLALSEIAASDLRGVNVHTGSRDGSDPMDFDYRLKPGVTTEANAVAIARMAGVPI